jgi:bis(5'-nucleosyl)-tetraphosphatase (symmetrical)
MRSARTFIVGDVHGCLQELKELLHVAGHRRGTDRLILLGDMIDRGPESAGVLRFAREVNADCILGNHEEKHLRWRRHERVLTATGKRNPMEPFPEVKLVTHASLAEEDWSFLEGLPHYLDVAPGVVAVHAGLEPSVAFASQRPNVLLRCRWIDRTKNRMASLDQDEPDLKQPPNSDFWTARWDGPESVIYGHHVHSKDYPDCAMTPAGAMCAGIDTGCCFGGRLTGVLFEGATVVDVIHVEAGTEYASWKAFSDRAI